MASFKAQNSPPPKIAEAKYVPTRPKPQKKQPTPEPEPETEPEPDSEPESTTPPAEGTDWEHISDWLRRFSQGLVGAFLIFHIFVEYFFTYVPAYGISMLPTVNMYGDFVWISKMYRRGRGIEVGDLVSFKSPVVVGEDAIKRVVGMEGDFVLVNTPGNSDAMIQVRLVDAKNVERY
jgi:inner membrane protease subunit 1